MLLRKLLLRSQTARNSDPSVSRKIIYDTENFWHGSDTGIVRIPKNVVRIACLHVLHSAVSTTAIKFWYGKIKFWYESKWAQFFWSAVRNHRMVRMRHILFKHGGGKVSGEYLLIKRGRLELGNDQYDQQRSINLFHWCVLEISQFYLCFLTLIDRHFYMPPLFFFGVYALSKLRSIVSYSMTLRRSSLVSVFFQNTPRDFCFADFALAILNEASTHA